MIVTSIFTFCQDLPRLSSGIIPVYCTAFHPIFHYDVTAWQQQSKSRIHVKKMAEVSSNVQNLLITAFLLLSFDKSMSFITVKNYQYLLTKHVLKHSFYHYSDLFEMLLKQIKYQQSKAAISTETEVWLLIEIGTLFLFTFAIWFFSPQNFKFIATRG